MVYYLYIKAVNPAVKLGLKKAVIPAIKLEVKNMIRVRTLIFFIRKENDDFQLNSNNG